jgi:molybdopterin-guanine dinucleotide biosynthesis protein A
MLGGVSLLDRAAAYAHPLSKVFAVAVRDEGQVKGADTPVIRDEEGIAGPLAGLVSALRFANEQYAEAVLTIPADMPFLPTDLAQRLIDGLGNVGAAIARSGGHLHPVCGLWSTRAIDLVPDYLASTRRSLKGFAETVGYVAVDWPDEPVDPFFNINSAQDLVQAEHLLATSISPE